MKHSTTGPSLGWIAFAGIVLGLIAWVYLGVGSPLSPKATPTAQATGTPAPVATETIWPLPTVPVFNWSQSPVEGGKAVKGAQAPDFELIDLDGNPVRLTDFQGYVVVLNFWASWCPPCREEMPDLQKLATDYAGKGLRVLAVNTTYADSPEAARKFVAELGLTLPVLLDETGKVTEEAYGVLGLPVSFWIDRKGIIQFINLGPMSLETMTGLADKYLAP